MALVVKTIFSSYMSTVYFNMLARELSSCYHFPSLCLLDSFAHCGFLSKLFPLELCRRRCSFYLQYILKVLGFVIIDYQSRTFVSFGIKRVKYMLSRIKYKWAFIICFQEVILIKSATSLQSEIYKDRHSINRLKFECWRVANF